eukprot:GHVS01066077.1.p1 GENE.GHVS01066077.1~~GHVS01066077.1.p1  ORF type:complete len:463 (+),score=67.49 GHVS01066077.1:92-1480(+)
MDYSQIEKNQELIDSLVNKPDGVKLDVVIDGTVTAQLPIPSFAGLLAFDEYVNKCLAKGFDKCSGGVKNWLEWAAVGAELAAGKNNPTTTTSLEGKDIKEVVIKPVLTYTNIFLPEIDLDLIDKDGAFWQLRKKLHWKRRLRVLVALDLDGDVEGVATLTLFFQKGTDMPYERDVVISTHRDVVMRRIASLMVIDKPSEDKASEPDLLYLWAHRSFAGFVQLAVVRDGNAETTDELSNGRHVYLALATDDVKGIAMMSDRFEEEAFYRIRRDVTELDDHDDAKRSPFRPLWKMLSSVVKELRERRFEFGSVLRTFLEGLGVPESVPHEVNRYLDFTTDELQEKVKHLNLILNDSRLLHQFAVDNTDVKTYASHLDGCDILKKDSLKVNVAKYMFHKDPQNLVENSKRAVVDLLLLQHNQRALKCSDQSNVHQLELKGLGIDEMVEKICSEDIRKLWEADGKK